MIGDDDGPELETGADVEIRFPEISGELSPEDRESFGVHLIEAVKGGYLEPVQSLIAAGVNVNFRDSRMGATALHYAAAYRFHSALVCLIRCGRCDYLIRDKRGMYPSEVAYEIADDPRAGAILAKMEARQAYKTGAPAWPKPESTTD